MNFGNGIVYFLNAMLGSFVVLSIVSLFEKAHVEKVLFILEYYGKNSLVVLGTHQIIMLILKVPIKNNFILNILFCCLIMIFEIPIIYLINKGQFSIKRGMLNGK